MNESKLDLNAIRKRAERDKRSRFEIHSTHEYTHEFTSPDIDWSMIESDVLLTLIAEVERLQKALEDIVSVDGKYIYRGSDADDAFDIAREALEHGEKV